MWCTFSPFVFAEFLTKSCVLFSNFNGIGRRHNKLLRRRFQPVFFTTCCFQKVVWLIQSNLNRNLCFLTSLAARESVQKPSEFFGVFLPFPFYFNLHFEIKILRKTLIDYVVFSNFLKERIVRSNYKESAWYRPITLINAKWNYLARHLGVNETELIFR